MPVASKEAAKRYGVSEAEIIRNAIHRAAMSSRIWDEPFSRKTCKRIRDESCQEAMDAAWEEKPDRYHDSRGDRS